MMQLPDSFIKTISTAYPNGREWLDELPALIDEAAQKWGLTDITPVPALSYNFVAFASQAGREIVLKIGPPNRELLSELNTLRLFNGQGACRQLECDETRYMFLLERLRPGKMLVELEDDEAATGIAADVMMQIWRKPVTETGFIKLSEWFSELNGLRPRYQGGTGPFPGWLVERVESILPDLFANGGESTLMHGDFHHFNVLSSERGWLVIDPKGVIGPRGYETGPLLVNPWADFLKRDAARITGRRVAILSERLGLARDLILDWALCHCLISAWWDLQPDDTGGEYALACAEVFAKLR
jgi:streptomycin 6-kinase